MREFSKLGNTDSKQPGNLSERPGFSENICFKKIMLFSRVQQVQEVTKDLKVSLDHQENQESTQFFILD